MKTTNDSDPAGLAAAEWVLRHDRGLTGAEQDEFSEWLAADARHRAAWAEQRWGWDELDRLAGLQTSVHAVPNPDLLMPRRNPWAKAGGTLVRLRFVRRLVLPMAAAATITLGFVLWQHPLVSPKPGEGGWLQPRAPRSLALIEQRELADGSVVELNRGAVLTERFTPGERRVRLVRGEAHFKVTKDTQRPFVVEAAGVAVCAVGTAFNVRLESAAVEVLVTEGKVRVRPEDGGPTTDNGGRRTEGGMEIAVADDALSSAVSRLSSGTLVAAGERAVVSLMPAAPAPQVDTMSPAEIEARLAWQPRLLDFTNAPLTEIVAEFNRRNPVHFTLGDPSLGRLRLSATFRSDNIDGFVRLMVSDFGMRAERRGNDMIVLRKVSAPQKP